MKNTQSIARRIKTAQFRKQIITFEAEAAWFRSAKWSFSVEQQIIITRRCFLWFITSRKHKDHTHCLFFYTSPSPHTDNNLSHKLSHSLSYFCHKDSKNWVWGARTRCWPTIKPESSSSSLTILEISTLHSDCHQWIFFSWGQILKVS